MAVVEEIESLNPLRVYQMYTWRFHTFLNDLFIQKASQHLFQNYDKYLSQRK